MTENRSIVAWEEKEWGFVGKNYKGALKTLGSEGYDHWRDCGNSIACVDVCWNYQIIHFKYL